MHHINEIVREYISEFWKGKVCNGQLKMPLFGLFLLLHVVPCTRR